MWWYIPTIPAHKKLRQEHPEFITTLGFRVRNCPQTNKTKFIKHIINQEVLIWSNSCVSGTVLITGNVIVDERKEAIHVASCCGGRQVLSLRL
jgi:hypothetical protein